MSESITDNEASTVDDSSNDIEDNDKLDNAIKGKHKLAVSKIDKAQNLSKNTQNMIEECMKNIDSDVDELNKKKHELFENTILPMESILSDLGVDDIVSQSVPENKVQLKESDDGKVEIKELSSGVVIATFYALISAVVVVLGWCYTAATQLGMPVIPKNGPDIERLNKALEWTSAQMGLGLSADIGGAIIIVIVLLVMLMVYLFTVQLRASNNLRVANEIEENVNLYCTDKDQCKKKMVLVREHIQRAIKILDDYRVALEELHAKLKRAMHVEKADSYKELHATTKDEILTAQQLIAELRSLSQTQIAENGVLTDEMVDRIDSAEHTLDEYIKKIYS